MNERVHRHRARARLGLLVVATRLVAWPLVGHAVTAEHFQVRTVLDLRTGWSTAGRRSRRPSAARDLVGHPRQDVPAQVAAFRSQMAQLGKDALQAREVAASAQARSTISSRTGEAAPDHVGRHRPGWAAASLGKHGQLREAAPALDGRVHGVRPVPVGAQEADRYLHALLVGIADDVRVISLPAFGTGRGGSDGQVSKVQYREDMAALMA